MPNFGFQTNGTYPILFSDFDPSRAYCIALLNQNEYAEAITHDVPCLAQRPRAFRLGDNMTDTEFSGLIPEKAIYTAYVSFYVQHRTRPKLTVVQIYRDPNSHLDYRWNGILPAQFAVATLLGVVVGYWIVNWCCHFSIRIGATIA
jgi:hypothetical protein